LGHDAYTVARRLRVSPASVKRADPAAAMTFMIVASPCAVVLATMPPLWRRSPMPAATACW
jgi:cation transport ATPase